MVAVATAKTDRNSRIPLATPAFHVNNFAK
jgi:hypothetical protein